MERIINAIKDKKVISFTYEGHTRTVEPHLLGENTKGNLSLRAYQISGFSSSGRLDWKMYIASKISDIEISENHFCIRSGYNPNDIGMKRIIARV